MPWESIYTSKHVSTRWVRIATQSCNNRTHSKVRRSNSNGRDGADQNFLMPNATILYKCTREQLNSIVTHDTNVQCSTITYHIHESQDSQLQYHLTMNHCYILTTAVWIIHVPPCVWRICS